MRKRFDDPTKARVAIEALIGFKMAAEIASQFKVHPSVVSKFKGKLFF